jgi:hypothetical protein
MQHQILNLNSTESIDAVGNASQQGRHVALGGTRWIGLREVLNRPASQGRSNPHADVHAD